MAETADKRQIILWCCITVAASLTLAYGCYKGYNLLITQEEFTIRNGDVAFSAPDWISEHGREKINELLLTQGEQNLFRKELTSDIALAYKKNDLYKRVISVNREFPNKVRIALELRKPLATVEDKRGRVYIVDAGGGRLSDKYFNWPISDEHNVNIYAKKLGDIPHAGKTWNDKRVLAGVSLVQFLKRNNADKVLNIAKIDVSNVGRRFQTRQSDIVLWTKNGTRIKWGCSPLCKTVDELSDTEKLRNLYSVASAAGNDFADMEYVDVRWTKPVGRKTILTD